MAYYVYILTDGFNRSLYIGVTNNLARRVWEHRERLVDGFAERYGLDKLVYHEAFADAYTAISREKELKKWRREKKNALIAGKNPRWAEITMEDIQ